MILAIDQSLTGTAVAILEELKGKPGKLRVRKTEVFSPKTKGIRRIEEIRYFIEKQIVLNTPSIIVRELHLHAMKGAGNAVAELNGVIDNTIYHRHNGELQTDDFRYYRIPGTVWKKYITGKGVLKKDTAYLKKLLEHLNKHKLLANEVDTDDDNIADAVALGLTAWGFHRWRVDKIGCGNNEILRLFVKNELLIFGGE